MSILDKLKDLPTLYTERLILRRCNRKDIPAMYAVASNPNVTKYVMWNPHASIEATTEFVEGMIAQYAEGTCHAWAICDRETDTFMGLITFTNIRAKHFKGELGYWIGEPYWGKGYMTEALGAVVDYAFNTLGMHRISAGHLVENPASGRVMQKIGMQFEGIRREDTFLDGAFHDIARYAIINEK